MPSSYFKYRSGPTARIDSSTLGCCEHLGQQIKDYLKSAKGRWWALDVELSRHLEDFKDINNVISYLQVISAATDVDYVLVTKEELGEAGKEDTYCFKMENVKTSKQCILAHSLVRYMYEPALVNVATTILNLYLTFGDRYPAEVYIGLGSSFATHKGGTLFPMVTNDAEGKKIYFINNKEHYMPLLLKGVSMYEAVTCPNIVYTAEYELNGGFFNTKNVVLPAGHILKGISPTIKEVTSEIINNYYKGWIIAQTITKTLYSKKASIGSKLVLTNKSIEEIMVDGGVVLPIMSPTGGYEDLIIKL